MDPNALLASGRLRGRRVGVVCNPASIDHGFVHTADRIAARGGAMLGGDFRAAARLPIGRPGEHDRDGARARRPAGACRSIRSTARRASRRRRCCAGLDVARHRPAGRRHPHLHLHLHDGELPDGRAASTASRSIVCDRPNPIGGVDVEGPMLVPGFESFVGLYPIPMRHGMTIGELARLFNEHFGIGADLEVVPMEGWQRAGVSRRHGRAVGDAVAEHPDARLGDRLSGHRALRGHERLRRSRHDAAVRAAWARPGVVAERFAGRPESARRCPAFTFVRPCSSRRSTSTRGPAAAAARFTCSIARAFRPVLTGRRADRRLPRGGPGRFAWREPPYEYEHEKLPFDILAGSSELREQIEAGTSPEEIADRGNAASRGVRSTFRQPFLLY